MRSKFNGFTLVEMAVVLIIIGFMMGAVLGVAKTQIQSSRIAATKQKQENIKLALINFVTRNNSLPCPAVATLAPGAAGYGVMAATPGTCTGATTSGNVVTGIVPWISLGLSDENGTDGYYNRYTYQVALAATNTNAQTIAGLKGAISIHSGTPIVLTPPVVGNQTNDCTPAGEAYNPCSAVAVIVSHGANAFGAYTTGGVQIVFPAPAGADESENADNDSAFVMKEYTVDESNPFDDIVLPLTSSDLLMPLTAHGSMQDFRASINDDVSNIKNALIAYAVDHKSGSSGSREYPIKNSLPNLPQDTKKDPWGNNYVYERKIDKVKSDTDGSDEAFLITSNGPDEAFGTNDDLPYTIYVNHLQDAFAKVGW